MTYQPRIHFKELKGFPPIGDKIETETFLNAAREIVAIIERFGKLFTPVVNDMHGNVMKLTETFEKNKKQFFYLEDLIVSNIGVNKNHAANALLWLKRALQMVCSFFENIIHDQQNSEVLRSHLRDAYKQTLEPYHGRFIRATVKLIYSWVPTRSQLIGCGSAYEENMYVLETFLPRMRNHLNRIDDILKINNLDDPARV